MSYHVSVICANKHHDQCTGTNCECECHDYGEVRASKTRAFVASEHEKDIQRVMHEKDIQRVMHEKDIQRVMHERGLGRRRARRLVERIEAKRNKK